MATYKVTAEFNLSTEIEPDIRGFGLNIDYDDNSYFGTVPADSSGGSITFEVEAEDESDADAKAEEIISSGMEVTDENGLTWLIEDVNFEIEADEVPMDKARAIEIIEALISASTTLTDEQKQAFEFMLAYAAGMTT